MNKKEAQPELVPRLRFPEFRNVDGWRKEPLSAIVTLEYGSPLPEKDRTGNGFPVVGSNGIVGYHQTATVSGPAIVVGRKGSVGQINLIEDDCTPIDTTFYVVPTRPKRDNFYFIWRLLESCRLDTLGDAGAVPGLNRNDVHARQTTVPDSAEQRKIAACLGSLDDLIAAEGRKLEALRNHKKGLMQQLFPPEGETRPRLRFAEFAGARVWINRKLDELAERGTGHTPDKTKPEYYNGGINWVSLADSKRLDQGLISDTAIEISEQGLRNSSAVLHPVGTVILSRDAGVGKSAVLAEQMAVSQHFVVWRCDPLRLSNWFFYYYLQKSKSLFEDIATGSTIKTIGVPFFKAMRVTVPEIDEQQRIADCLASLDAMIAAQAEMLDALRTHKRGLMQQLFPSPTPEGAAT